MSEEFQYPSSFVDIGTTKEAIIITNASADTSTPGADHACKRALIKAHTTNTGLVWAQWIVAAVEVACYPLEAGETVNCPANNTNEIFCLFKVGNEKVTVVYSN